MENQKHQSVKVKPGRSNLIWGLLFGIIFGFLLQKGGVTKYNVIIGQLLLEDFTVLKIMLSAVVTGMIGIYFMKTMGWVNLYPKTGSIGMSVIGGLIFGVGFALLGYCPGTVAGAVGNGYMDALFGGVIGIFIGAGLFASLYRKVKHGILQKGDLATITFPELFKVNDWIVVLPTAVLLILILYWLESAGL